MRCDIIIPVWNQLRFTQDCVDSILKNTDGRHRLILVDNGSDFETKSYLESLKESKTPEISVIRNEKNLGFVKAVNQGIGLSDAAYVCILNNDTLVTKNWLEIMLDIAEKERTIGIMNPSSNTLGQRPAIGERIEFYADSLGGLADKFVELGAAVGFCMLIKRDLIDRIGVFDEIYGMGNFEDTDFSRRAIKEGYKCVRACGAYVYHRESASFNRMKTFEEEFRRNRDIYEFRWGRPKRMAYLLDQYDDNILKRLKIESLKMARDGNWVWYFYKEDIDFPVHSNIICNRLPSKNFYPKVVFKILKKKKRFDRIFVGSKLFGKVLRSLSFIHRAKISYY